MELLGSRSATRAATMAWCPRFPLLAAGPASRAHGGCGGQASSVEILRVGRKGEEPESRRKRNLELLATIPVPGDGFHRLAWSATDATSPYPLGLLAGALDGIVCVWDPSLLPCEKNASQIGDDYDCFFTLSACTSDFFRDPSSSTYNSDSSSFPNKFPQKFQKKVEEEALRMTSELKNLIEGKFTVEDHKESNPTADNDGGELDGWELVPGRVGFDLDEWELLPNKLAKATGHGKTDGLLLKLHDMKGQVLGLSFNNPSGNVLACGGVGDKLKLYYLDCPIKTCEMVGIVSQEFKAQISSLDWHPVYPVQVASASVASVAKIWDLRAKKPTCRFLQENKGRCTEISWNPRHPLQLAVASTGTEKSDPVEIWDARVEKFPLCKFGPEKGVVSLSWCSDPNMILTTDVEGVADAWKLNEIEGSNPSWTRYNPPDHIPLHSTGREEILWCDNEDVVAVSCSTNIGLYKLKPLSPYL